jgi:hypothetical protein
MSMRQGRTTGTVTECPSRIPDTRRANSFSNVNFRCVGLKRFHDFSTFACTTAPPQATSRSAEWSIKRVNRRHLDRHGSNGLVATSMNGMRGDADAAEGGFILSVQVNRAEDVGECPARLWLREYGRGGGTETTAPKRMRFGLTTACRPLSQDSLRLSPS